MRVDDALSGPESAEDGPLKGVRVLDFGHTVMGPSCAMILADLGADVIKIEPVSGDPTRRLKGFGLGYFGYFNRNKRSVALDLKSDAGRETALRLCETADILIENFSPGAMERLGLGYERLRELNDRLIFVSLKGFLDGPYKERLALDEVVQMMSGLAYMTGPTGRPLRAGTSAVDIAGGMFGVIGALLALRERDRTGRGSKVESALFESAVFLMGQHLCYAAQSRAPIPPMPERVSAWAVYDLFDLADGRQIFVGITSDQHFDRFAHAIDRPDLLEDPRYATNNDRIEARPTLLRLLRELFEGLSTAEASALCERARIPFAPVARPEDLFTDPHLAATGGLLEAWLPNDTRLALPRLPLALDQERPAESRNPPTVGEHTAAVLIEAGVPAARVAELVSEGKAVDGSRPDKNGEERSSENDQAVRRSQPA